MLERHISRARPCRKLVGAALRSSRGLAHHYLFDLRCVCVRECVYVFVRERERERESARARARALGEGILRERPFSVWGLEFGVENLPPLLREASSQLLYRLPCIILISV